MADSFKLLDTVEPGALPVINDLVFTNAVNRIAGIAVGSVTLEDRHVGKIALQEDNNSLWRCLQVTPTLKWSQVSGKDVSESNFTIYVDWDTGNDITGDGSVAHPYKSYRFLDNLAKLTTDHTIRIKTTANVNYDYWPKYWEPYTAGGGRIIFDSSAETFPVYKGPFTITTVTPVGNAAHFGVAHATDLVVSGAGWTVDEFYGKFIRMLTGNWAGYVLYLHKNTADTVTTIADWEGFAPGDTFEIVTEPVVITVDYPIWIRGNSNIHEYNDSTVPDTPFEPSILFCGIKFVSSAFHPYRLENINAVFSACTFWSTYATADSEIIWGKDISINYDGIPSGSFDVAVFENFYNFACNIIPYDGNPSMAPGIPICFIGKGAIFLGQVSMRGELRLRGAAGVSATFGLLVGKCTAFVSGEIAHEYTFVEQIGFDTLAFIADHTKRLVIKSAYARHYEGALLTDNSYILIQWYQGEDPYVATHACNMDQPSSVRVYDPTNVTILGTTGAVRIRFPSSGETLSATWPALNAVIENGYGTRCWGDNTQ